MIEQILRELADALKKIEKYASDQDFEVVVSFGSLQYEWNGTEFERIS